MITSLVIVASVTVLAAGLGLTAWWIDRPEKPHHKPVALKRALRHLTRRAGPPMRRVADLRLPATRVTFPQVTRRAGAITRRLFGNHPLRPADARTLTWVRDLAHHEDAHPLPGELPAPTDAGPGEYGALYADDTSWRQFTALKEVS